MLERLNNRLTYLGISLLLLLVALPLISIGATRGIPLLWRVGLVAFIVGGLIPPVQRLLSRTSSPA